MPILMFDADWYCLEKRITHGLGKPEGRSCTGRYIIGSSKNGDVENNKPATIVKFVINCLNKIAFEGQKFTTFLLVILCSYFKTSILNNMYKIS